MSRTALPASLLVIGASAVGLELGQLYHRFGSQVTVLEALGRILPAEDPDVSHVLHKALTAEGLGLYPATRVTRVTSPGRGTARRRAVGGADRDWPGAFV